MKQSRFYLLQALRCILAENTEMEEIANKCNARFITAKRMLRDELLHEVTLEEFEKTLHPPFLATHGTQHGSTQRGELEGAILDQ